MLVGLGKEHVLSEFFKLGLEGADGITVDADELIIPGVLVGRSEVHPELGDGFTIVPIEGVDGGDKLAHEVEIFVFGGAIGELGDGERCFCVVACGVLRRDRMFDELELLRVVVRKERDERRLLSRALVSTVAPSLARHGERR